MSIAFNRALHPLGTHRVVDPAGALPQNALKIDNTPVAMENEILCDVEALSIDRASFDQMSRACGGDPAGIARAIAVTVQERGKLHNAVTGSGGVFIGRVLKVGEQLRGRMDLNAGERIASLVSLTLTPLFIESVTAVDTRTAQVKIRGKAILFESALWAKLPRDITDEAALAAFEVAGVPAQVQRLSKPGMTVVVIGAGGTPGMLACAQAKRAVGADGKVIALAADIEAESMRILRRAGVVDAVVKADARDPLCTSRRVSTLAPQLADLVVNCVSVADTEPASVLCAKDEGTVCFFSMATSFAAAALGAEGAAKDVTMIIGSAYAKDLGDTALDALREYPDVLRYFIRKYSQEGSN